MKYFLLATLLVSPLALWRWRAALVGTEICLIPNPRRLRQTLWAYRLIAKTSLVVAMLFAGGSSLSAGDTVGLASRMASPSTIELKVSGTPGTAVQIESSTDLKVWEPVERLANPVSVVTVTYAIASRERFYRAQLLVPASPAGIWFGQFVGQLDNGGFGVLVSQDKQAVVVGYNTPQDEGVFKSGVVVGAGGGVDFISTQGSHIVGGFTNDTLSGRFVDLAGPGGTFSGTRQVKDGAFAATAGYYSGSYSGALTGTARAIMSASGKLFFYTSDMTGDGGGFGQVNPQNQLTAKTVAGADITGTLEAASLTLSGTYSIGGQVGGAFQLARQFGP